MGQIRYCLLSILIQAGITIEVGVESAGVSCVSVFSTGGVRELSTQYNYNNYDSPSQLSPLQETKAQILYHLRDPVWELQHP